jgi:hypothetical protein
MKRGLRFKKRAWVLFAAVAAVAAMASIGAYAYWTTDGTGTGTATVGTDADNLVLHGSVADLMYPGGPGATVSFEVDNPSDFNQSVSEIQLVDVDAYPTALDRTNETNELAGCGGPNSATSDFQMADVTVDPATDGDIDPNAVGQDLTTTGTLYMNNLDSNQDACKNAFLTLNLTSS